MTEPPSNGLSDEQFENLLAILLRGGVLLAATIVVVGAIPYLATHANHPMDHRTFEGEPADLRSPIGIVKGAAELHGRAIIQLGLLALIATPVMRVVLSVFGFARQHDRTYVVITISVLAVLLFSLCESYFL